MPHRIIYRIDGTTVNYKPFRGYVLLDEQGKVRKASRVIGYMLGWLLVEIQDYCLDNRWTLRRMRRK